MSALSNLIRRWESLHPYNFIDTLELIEPVEHGQLARTAHDTLVELRGPMPAIPCREGIDSARELELPFEECDAPVRIAYESLGAAPGARQRLGVSFRHACFDGQTALVFVRRMLSRARGEGVEPLEPIGELPEVALSPRAFVRSIRNLLRMRGVRSRSGSRNDSPRNAILELPLDESLLRRLREEAEGCPGASVNDVLLFRLARGMRGLDGDPTGRRRETAIAVAASLDREKGVPHLGVDVAFFPVFLGDEPPTLELVQEQSSAAKRTREWEASTLEMRFASAIWPWICRGERGRYLARNYVVTAGMTNVVTERLEGVASWRRAVSTGPVAPLVLSVLTAGENLTLTITWREARFSRGEVESVAGVLTGS